MQCYNTSFCDVLHYNVKKEKQAYHTFDACHSHHTGFIWSTLVWGTILQILTKSLWFEQQLATRSRSCKSFHNFTCVCGQASSWLTSRNNAWRTFAILKNDWNLTLWESTQSLRKISLISIQIRSSLQYDINALTKLHFFTFQVLLSKENDNIVLLF